MGPDVACHAGEEDDDVSAEKDLSEALAAVGLSVPEALHRVHALGLTRLEPWSFLEAEELSSRLAGLTERYVTRRVVPFAGRQDDDDVACFLVAGEEGPPGTVLVIHDFASPGWEVRQVFDSFWGWFRLAIEDLIEGSELDRGNDGPSD
ncbi:MAG: hypothetical protein AAF533_10380 [Acidobacteriota bacterium]